MLISTRKLPVEHGNGIQNKNTREYLLQLGCTPELYVHEKSGWEWADPALALDLALMAPRPI